MNSKLTRTPGLYLAGFMASGKSTIARRVADELGWYFADLDADIEAAEGVTIAALFETRGEPEFRRIESEALKRCVRLVQHGKPHVIALGGGAFTEKENLETIKDNGISIWLDASLDLIRRRLEGCAHRPLARDPVKLEQLYELRRAAYAHADFRIEIASDDPAAAVAAILKLPIF